MKANKYLVIVAVCFFISSCESKVKQYLKNMDKKLFFHNNYENWKVQELPHNSFRIAKMDLDTAKVLSFEVGDGDIPIVNEYTMEFPCFGSDNCYVSMISYGDTLFYYRENTRGVKNFIIGEYAYRYAHMILDSAELEYYGTHEDSLRRIRGSNLPTLH